MTYLICNFIVILRNSLIGSESNRSTYSNNEDERPAELISSELGETIWTRANENFSILERFSKLAVSVGETLVSRDLSAMSHARRKYPMKSLYTVYINLILECLMSIILI